MKHNNLILAVSALALAACGNADLETDNTYDADLPVIDEQTEPMEEPVVADEAPIDEVMVLTAEGLGPIEIGMTRAELIAAVGGPSNPDAVTGVEPETCEIFHPAEAPEGVFVMLHDTKVETIYINEDSDLATEKGITIGDTSDDVVLAYGEALIESPAKYDEPPARDLTVWTAGGVADTTWVEDPDARGIRFKIGTDNHVRQIHVGGDGIQLVEGCS